MTVLNVADLRYSVRRHFWTSRREILRGVTFHVNPGEIFAFLGPNGAGKTTTIKAILGLVRPDRGSVTILGGQPTDTEVRRRLGYMPEHPYFSPHLTARELVLMHARLAGLPPDQAARNTTDTLALVGLKDASDRKLGTYSKGMLQRAGLAQAVVGDPSLVILDEPMSGLDPIGRRDVREMMLALRSAGKTVFFSTHILPDVEAVADRVAMMKEGRVRRIEDLRTLMRGTVRAVTVTASAPFAPGWSEADGVTIDPDAHDGAVRMTARDVEHANALVDHLRNRGATILDMQLRRVSLEDVFVSHAADSSEEP